MYNWGKTVAAHARTVLLIGIVAVIGSAIYGIGAFGNLINGGFENPASESYKVAEAVQRDYPDQRIDAVAVYSSDTLTVDDPAFAEAVDEVVTGLDPEHVETVLRWQDVPGLVSEDRHTVQMPIRFAQDGDSGRLDDYDAVRDDLDASGLTTHVGGEVAVFTDVNATVGADIARAEMIAIPIVLVLSLFIFGSVVSALMPTMVGAIAVLGAFAVVRAITGVTDVSIFAINVITLLGMGLAIDYALFVVSRFREELAAQPGTDRSHRISAMARTMATAGRTVLFSGVIVAASLASLLIFPQTFLRSMGYGGIAAVVVAMIASLTILPATLVALGPKLEWGRVRKAPTAVAHDGERPHGWGAVAANAMKHPVAWLVATLAVLALLSSPFLGASFGSVDEHVLPEDSPSRVATAQLSDAFGAMPATARVLIDSTDPAVATAFAAEASEIEGVTAQVAGATDTNQLVVATWEGNAQSPTSQDIARDLRAIDPDVATVGGASATTVDLLDSVSERLPWMAALAATVMFVLLFIAFGSVVLPLKAIAMNVLSLGASFGVVTWIFADGNLTGLLGFTSSGYLDATQPILMLAILFGLSMDYEVFLLSRVREEWDRTGDNTASVIAGVQRSGPIITSAALLLAVVIGGFATSGIVFLKMIGVGMLVAVLLDATVIRGLLVPVTMRLLGRANWWAPAPMQRWWERHGHRESAVLPET